MVSVRLTRGNVLIGSRICEAGEVHEVSEVHAQALFEAGAATYSSPLATTPTPEEITRRRIENSFHTRPPASPV